jgi:hypothetical protein
VRGGLAAARVAIVLVSLVAAVAVVEAGLRRYGGVFHDPLVQFDPVRGWALRPNYSGWVRTENTLWMHINSDGLRDREHARAKPRDALRIALLGDSMMQGMNVPLEKTFHAYLEAALQPCAAARGRQAEVINFAVLGYGTAQELLTFRGHAAGYHPDIVLLAFFSDNDLSDNSRALSSKPRPYFSFEGDRLVLDGSAIERVAEREPVWRAWRIRATDASRALGMLYEQGWVPLRRWLAQAGGQGSGAAVDGDGFDVYRAPRDPAGIEAWRITERLLLMLRDDVAASGAQFWLATLATAEQTEPDLRVRDASMRAHGGADLYYPDTRIAAFATAHGIPVVTLAPQMAAYAAAHRVFLNGGYNAAYPPGSGHWNEVATQLAAHLVADRLCRESVGLD